MVIDAARSRLFGVERAVVIARFAPLEAVKRVGVTGLVDALAGGSPVGNLNALESLVWRRYVPKGYRDGYSLRAIAKRTGVSKSTLARASEWIDGQCDGFEPRALRRLEETFVPHGV
ncbi:helix-turn-helix domain-containing protein [Paraburkholderia tropica]|uniref:Uncharacterized protein n=1 Tax=Paraburkholderia tropica TaxID=92647 RepID=A0AAQ1JSP0_9BURK|nr:helix-turn-helix domain-containing protein [Paraburkholderia tropica]RQN39607.1 helix-turn-helix domain-containing protein [Paraburkholderia tropica]SEJ20037.1 hypothetical protein SAMN05216550_103132 [Paraburkholderia tropica]